VFTVTIKTDNAAFGESDEEKAQEVARILRGLANDLEFVFPDGNRGLYDYNGNRVGSFTLEP
jgi:hypothetical protein